MALQHSYTEENIRSLDWKEHIRLRPGMYIGKLGDGSSIDDGIYILLKEVIDNCIDEYVMGYGKEVDIEINDGLVSVRDYGRGIPLGKVIECVSQINTGGKYDSKAFKKSVGLNGVGTKAVNALSSYFMVQSVREGKCKVAEFSYGNLTKEYNLKTVDEPNGTTIVFRPDDKIFTKFRFIHEFIESRIWHYAYLNAGLRIHYLNKTYVSKNGLKDMLERRTDGETIHYPLIHLKGEDIEVVITHGLQYGEQYYSFVNGQYTSQGGTHLNYFREAIVKTVREFYKKDFDVKDIHTGIIGAISVRIEEPVFESQTKTKLGSTTISPDGASLRSFIMDFISKELNNYLHKTPETAKEMLSRILQSERERKEIAGIKKLANQRAKKANLHNKKLRDCRVHLTDSKMKSEIRDNSTLFITEGDSASGSITKSRNVESQAVFSLRGKPLNCFGMTKKIVYENEELNLLQHALDIEDGIENLRFNKVVIATDADVDGMHIRLLLLTFFLQFFPELVRNGHLFILETPLFRVRDKRQTFYCYSEKEKQEAIKNLRGKAEITRFKGLGEISPEEFGNFIGPDIRLEPVILNEDSHIETILGYYMGKNTPERQDFIIGNLRVDIDQLKPDEMDTLNVDAEIQEELVS
ncbi:MAG: type IIA DNA topoisomerase subunit B [Saprospiraceae bacterium]|jgi:topoisomerase IV subunit B|nr:type IIA DNA topoisomerase subunit B [Candidatus Vicinibacter proximus]MBL7824688.1 type IIA DNA topoisomerase subunit B [Saprospiraceae bacterium]MCC6843990.1 type IIA DNA topoisomerase subunit B [Saprospiraceae bacterium]HRG32408.1 DNA topoisomerase IV subunit B [Saprospiraceae bacterium]